MRHLNHFENNLEKLMKEKGISIYALYRQMGMGPSQTLYRFRDKTGDLQTSTARSLVNAINELDPENPITMNDLLPL